MGFQTILECRVGPWVLKSICIIITKKKKPNKIYIALVLYYYTRTQTQSNISFQTENKSLHYKITLSFSNSLLYLVFLCYYLVLFTIYFSVTSYFYFAFIFNFVFFFFIVYYFVFSFSCSRVVFQSIVLRIYFTCVHCSTTGEMLRWKTIDVTK